MATLCWGLRTSKPNGFVSRSPGLLVLRRLCEAGQATLGAHVTKLPQPQRGCVLFVWLLPETSRCGINRPKTTQPRVGVDELSFKRTQGSSQARNPGLWGANPSGLRPVFIIVIVLVLACRIIASERRPGPRPIETAGKKERGAPETPRS